jgi:peptide/nickel transport system permease protein
VDVSELSVQHGSVVEAAGVTNEPGPAARPESRTRARVVGSTEIVVGLAVFLVATASLESRNGWLRLGLAILGLALVYRGADHLLKAARGPDFDTAFWVSLGWIVLLVLAAIFADLIPFEEHVDAAQTLTLKGNEPPELFSSHPLGTNNLALDLLGRSVYGARVSLLTAAFAVTVSIIVGGAIGMLAGYHRGWFDGIVGLFTDTVLAFPALVLLLALATVFGKPTEVLEAVLKSGVSLAIVGLPTMIRLARANTLTFAQREFVLSARAMGARSGRIVFRELLPNVLLTLVSFGLILMAVLIVAEGSLSFLGLGLQLPQPSWGNMIAEGQDSRSLLAHPFIPIVPGSFMFVTLLCFNRVGEKARRAWDPRELKV